MRVEGSFGGGDGRRTAQGVVVIVSTSDDDSGLLVKSVAEGNQEALSCGELQ